MTPGGGEPRAGGAGTTLPSEQELREYWQHALDADAKAWDSIRSTPEHNVSVKRAVRELADPVKAR